MAAMKTWIAAAFLALMLSAGDAPNASTQLAAPGDSGVVMGHLHLAVKDLDAHRKFWGALGGTPVQNGALALIQFPGTFVMLRQAEPTGGTVGSTINHVGFLVKDIAPWIAKWQAAGLKMEPQARPTQVYLIGPDDVRVEILEDKTIDVPLKMHHLHFYVASPLETQAWYAKTFGAAPGKRGQFDAADLPGVNLTFAKADTPTVGDQRALARSHRLRGEEPRGVLQEARSGRHQAGSSVHAAARTRRRRSRFSPIRGAPTSS